jgi:hypothetical protein
MEIEKCNCSHGLFVAQGSQCRHGLGPAPGFWWPMVLGARPECARHVVTMRGTAQSSLAHQRPNNKFDGKSISIAQPTCLYTQTSTATAWEGFSLERSSTRQWCLAWRRSGSSKWKKFPPCLVHMLHKDVTRVRRMAKRHTGNKRRGGQRSLAVVVDGHKLWWWGWRRRPMMMKLGAKWLQGYVDSLGERNREMVASRCGTRWRLTSAQGKAVKWGWKLRSPAPLIGGGEREQGSGPASQRRAGPASPWHASVSPVARRWRVGLSRVLNNGTS